MSPAEAAEWVEDRLSVLAFGNALDLLDDHCEAPTGWTPASGEQGEVVNKILVIRGEAYANGIRQMFPVLPRIGSVPPLTWGPMATGTCTVNGTAGDCYASHHGFHEAHLHLLEAIVTAEGAITRFTLVDSLVDVGWVGAE